MYHIIFIWHIHKKNTNKPTKKEEEIKLFNTLKSIGIVKKHIFIHTYKQIGAQYKYNNII